MLTNKADNYANSGAFNTMQLDEYEKNMTLVAEMFKNDTEAAGTSQTPAKQSANQQAGGGHSFVV